MYNILLIIEFRTGSSLFGIPMGTNLGPSSSQHVFLYSYEAAFIQSLLTTGRKQLTYQFNFTHRYIDDVLSINNPNLRNTWARCISLNLRSKTWQRAALLLLTLIHFCQSGGMVIFILPFLTNATSSISISQMFRSWVAIYQLLPPMASLSHSS